MASKIHISTARKMLDAGDPVDLWLWASDGRVLHYRNCVGLRYNFRTGTRQVKLLDSREIRTVRDVCIFKINDIEIFL